VKAGGGMPSSKNGGWHVTGSKRPGSSGTSRPSSARERSVAAGSAASYARGKSGSTDSGKVSDGKKSQGTVDSRVYKIEQRDDREQDGKVVLSAREPRSQFPITTGEDERHREPFLSARGGTSSGNRKNLNSPKGIGSRETKPGSGGRPNSAGDSGSRQRASDQPQPQTQRYLTEGTQRLAERNQALKRELQKLQRARQQTQRNIQGAGGSSRPSSSYGQNTQSSANRASNRPGSAANRHGSATNRPGSAANRPGSAANRPGSSGTTRPGSANAGTNRWASGGKQAETTRPSTSAGLYGRTQNMGTGYTSYGQRPGSAATRPGSANRPGSAGRSRPIYDAKTGHVVQVGGEHMQTGWGAKKNAIPQVREDILRPRSSRGGGSGSGGDSARGAQSSRPRSTPPERNNGQCKKASQSGAQDDIYTSMKARGVWDGVNNEANAHFAHGGVSSAEERTYLQRLLLSGQMQGKSSSEFYAFGKVLGVGSFGKVRTAWHKLSGCRVAIKTYEKAKSKDPNQWKRVQQEVRLMERLNHVHVIRLFEAIESPKRVHIVMEHCGGGNLCNYVKLRKRLGEDEARFIFQQVSAAVEYMHSLHIIHRDIKLENILFDDERNMKLVDFGFSVYVKDKKLKIFCGTPSYMAPEIIQRKEYFGRPVDVWSLGVLLYACLCGFFPFTAKNYQDLYRRILRGAFKIPDTLSPGSKDLIRNLLVVDPHRRFTLSQVRSHPWILQKNDGYQSSNKASKAHLVSPNPVNDLSEPVLSKIEEYGISRDVMKHAVLHRQHNCITTIHYLLLSRLRLDQARKSVDTMHKSLKKNMAAARVSGGAGLHSRAVDNPETYGDPGAVTGHQRRGSDVTLPSSNSGRPTKHGGGNHSAESANETPLNSGRRSPASRTSPSSSTSTDVIKSKGTVEGVDMPHPERGSFSNTLYGSSRNSSLRTSATENGSQRNGRVNTNQIGNSATDVDIHKGTGQPVVNASDDSKGGWVGGGGLLDLMDELGTN